MASTSEFPLDETNLAQLGFDNSSRASIIFTLSSGKIRMVNKAACKLLGYSQKALLSINKIDVFATTKSDFKKLLQQQITAKKPTLRLTAIRNGGKRFPCEMNYAVFKDLKGIATVIVSIADRSQSILDQLHIDTLKDKGVAKNIKLAKKNQRNIDIKNKKIVAENIDIAKFRQKNIDTRNKMIVDHNIQLAKAKSEEEKREYEGIGKRKVLAEIEENFKILFNLSTDVLFDVDLAADTLSVNDAYETEFGYKPTQAGADGWSAYIHPGDKKEVMKDYHRVLKSKEIEWKTGYRFLRADGSVANVLSSRIILRNTDDKAYRMIGSMKDISKQTVLEERLEHEIRLKEAQITEAAEDAKDTERSDIGKELHDNVNQLLGASRLYLEMAKGGGKDSEIYLSRSSEYTLTAIEEIRKLSKGLTTDIIKNLGLCAAIENIRRDTMEVSRVKIVLQVKNSIESSVNDKFKLNVYRIIQEQLNNILKHAKATKVIIKLLENKKRNQTGHF